MRTLMLSVRTHKKNFTAIFLCLGKMYKLFSCNSKTTGTSFERTTIFNRQGFSIKPMHDVA